MKKIFLILMIVITTNLYAIDNYLFNTGLSLYSSYDVYHKDLSSANNENSFFKQFTKPSYSVNLGVYRRGFYGMSNDNLIWGVNWILGSHDIFEKSISQKLDNNPAVSYSFFGLEGVYFLNKIYNGVFFKGSIGMADIGIGKWEYSSNSSGFGCKLGLGYALNINPDDSAVLIGIDSMYLTAGDKAVDGKKLNYALTDFSAYASLLW